MRDDTTTQERGAARYGPWLCVLLAVSFAAFFRLRLADLPLERDEGGFAYIAELLLDGVPPYLRAYDMRLPGSYFAYAAFMAVGGHTAAAIRIGLLLVNAATTLAVFLLGQRLFDATAGAVAAAFYALVSLSPAALGFAAHTTQFVALPAVAGAWILARAPAQVLRSRRLSLAGLLMGTAFIMKQSSLAFAAFGGLWVCWCAWRERPPRGSRAARCLLAYALGCALPFAAVCAFEWWAGAFPRFWFWTFSYARAYATRLPLEIGLFTLRFNLTRLIAPGPGLWLLAAAGVLVVLARERREVRVFALGFLLFSSLAVVPGLHFREHYFIVLLPAAGILAGAATSALRAALGRRRLPGAVRQGALAALLLLAFGPPVWRLSKTYLRQSPTQIMRGSYNVNPFPESIPIADYLRAHTADDARIAVIGSEPQIYFYAKRRAATAYLYMYGLTERQPYAAAMRRDMMAEVEAAKPEYLVFVDVFTSWLWRGEARRALLSWYRDYAQKNYELVGVVDLITPERTEYRWDDEARDYQTESRHYVQVLRRRD